MQKSKILGGLLLIMGTSIGGGLLALPIATAPAGFSYSIIFLIISWGVMLAGALLTLEANARLPIGSNMISMARKTLGLPGEIAAWIAYIFLLYALLCGYIAGSSDMLSSLIAKAGLHLSRTMTTLLFTSIFGMIVYAGIKAVDYANRFLMFGKFGIYGLLIMIVAPFIQSSHLVGGNIDAIPSCLMILVTSFGFAAIIPTLRDYFNNDIVTLKKVIIYGSGIPLICYICWNAVIMGTIPAEGDVGLIQLLQSDSPTSSLVQRLFIATQSEWIAGFFSFFTSICMLTAFLSISLAVFDFLADGFKLQKSGFQGFDLLILTFVPPVIFVIYNPGLYIKALSFAGISCVILHLLLPVGMAFMGRRQETAKHCPPLIPGGNFGLLSVGIISLILLFIAYDHP